MRNHLSSFGDFRCTNCGALVSSLHMLSGVNNRNHCPYCLWSCHLDLYSAGDRLSACKAGMKPIGLTLKRSRNKYQADARGELMLVHACVDCATVSINRIAADDDPEAILSVFQSSLEFDQHDFYSQQGIAMLDMEDAEVVHTQLFGQAMPT
ncbi:hypothetical protein ANAEL_03615 [Anaerolineales bacterium]|nr:hypothetical protein ANAEL_03615 [Anaerolineales bacterium]